MTDIHMVDIGEKPFTQRVAKAFAQIFMQTTTLQQVMAKKMEKGDVLTVAQTAGIMAAKNCPALIPLCHPLPIHSIQVHLEPNWEQSCIDITATVKVTGQTGVEMEALTAVSLAALTVYDMCKPIDKEMTIGSIMLLEKEGGKSGHYIRS